MRKAEMHPLLVLYPGVIIHYATGTNYTHTLSMCRIDPVDPTLYGNQKESMLILPPPCYQNEMMVSQNLHSGPGVVFMSIFFSVKTSFGQQVVHEEILNFVNKLPVSIFFVFS